MSHVRGKSIVEKVAAVAKSPKRFTTIFLKDTMAGQKSFLFNERLPRVINISFTEFTCMYSCRMCPYFDDDVRDMYKVRSEMSFDTLKNIVASVPNDAHYSFDMSSIGETLIFKELPEFVAFMKRERPLVNTIISTNGLPLTEKMFVALMKAGLDNIQFSLYAQNAADHKYITGTDTFDRVIANVRAAIRLRAEAGAQKPYLQAFMMHCKETAATTQAFLDEWTPLVDQAFLRPLYNLGRDMPGMTPIFEKEISSSRHPCVVPWYSTAIRSNGDVLPCYMFHWQRGAKDVVIGNINEQTLEEIWRSPKFLEFREAHLKLALADHKICEDCDLWAAYTDIWKPDVSGGFAYAPVQARDFFKVARGYRGG